jgi:hypothetical protein
MIALADRQATRRAALAQSGVDEFEPESRRRVSVAAASALKPA